METPPEHLYHYTSLEGLMGILTNRCLWATNIYFVNDTQELLYADGVIKKVADQLLKEYPFPPMPEGESLLVSTDPKVLLSAFHYHLGIRRIKMPVGWYPIFVFSLSEEKDLLSQWRAYCPRVGGYAIGFRSDLLIELLRTTFPNDLFLERCIYKESDQDALVKQMIMEKGDTFVKAFTGNPQTDFNGNPQKYSNVQDYFSFNAIMFGWPLLRHKGAVLKHPAFHEEREWRIVSDKMGSPNILFRIRNSMLIPYLPISFATLTPFLIDEIIIGPGPQQSLAYTALDQFLFYSDFVPFKDKANLMNKIKTSQIPYRA